MYDIVAKPVLNNVFNGWNGTIFAYGQTSSGKTFTMQGLLTNDKLKGIIPRIVDGIFEYIDDAAEHIEFVIKVSMLEIYMENLTDLLNINGSKAIKIRETPTKGVFIENLLEFCVGSEGEVMEIITTGNSNRRVGRTDMNAVSSRSHLVTIVNIQQQDSGDGSIKKGKLYLVDLAGSEKVGKTGAKGLLLEQAKLINKSLLCLGNVISALTESKPHIPYRDSKLTRVLQESLGGNSRTTLIITCSPSLYNEAETISTLRFGKRAKQIKNKLTQNKELSVEQLKSLLSKAEKKIKKLETYNTALEKLCAENGLEIPESLVRDMKLEFKTNKRKSQVSDKYPSANNNTSILLSEKMKNQIEAQNEALKKQYEKTIDELQAKCNILLQENKELREKNDMLKTENKNIQEEFNEYMRNQENMDHSIMKVNPHDESMMTVNKSFLNMLEGQEIKNASDFDNFLNNLSLGPQDREAMNKYLYRLKKKQDKEAKYMNRLKRIINELLSNYQKLIETELPDLQKHHDIVLESLKENERKHVIAFNDKILGILNQYFNKNEKLEEEIKKKKRREKELIQEIQMVKEQNKLVIKGLTEKFNTLKKCMNICYKKFKEFKSSKKVDQNVQYTINLGDFSSFSSNMVSFDNTRGTGNAFLNNGNAAGNQRVLKFLKGRKKQ